MIIRNTLCILAFLIVGSCGDKHDEVNISDSDHIVFGHFYGFCAGEECIEIFKLTQNALFEDISDTYPRWDRYYEGNYVQLDQSKFELVKSLSEHIPAQLLAEKDTVFGSPDAADGGGIYFAIKDGESARYWVMDQVDQNIPEYLRSFKGKINESIALINN
jgi:hypothetical protein